MSDLQNNVRFTWQLVSQFVSWEFCRYMNELKEDNAPETDVLTFLRNMIVQRTEKPMSEITKHEIVAKFIMETKEIQHISRMSCIIPLSESVKKIFPELEPTVDKLVQYLETFLNVLESAVEDRKELIHVRIQDAINDFIKEANRFLPQPHLLQVIESWNIQHRQSPPKPVKKVVYNAMLFEKVLECLHYESITPAEAKLIAVSLYEDKVFEKNLRNAEAEPETEADSEQFSLSMQSSQPIDRIYSQEFMKNTQACNANDIPVNPQCQNTECNIPDSLQLNSPVMPNDFVYVPDICEFESNKQGPDVISAASPPSHSPPVYPFLHRDFSKNNEDVILENNEAYNHMQFAQSSANESQSEGCNSVMEGTITKKFRQIYENQKNNKISDSDTSDCDKHAEIRFLTPTLFKKNKKKKPPPKPNMYLSDSDSHDSSVITAVGNSQKIDPNWSSKLSNHELVKVQKKIKSKKKLPSKPPKKTVRLLDSDDSDDNSSVNRVAASALHQPSTSAVHSDSEHEIPTKKRRVENVKLYRSPNASILDFVSRRPTPTTSNGIPIHIGTNTRSLRTRPATATTEKNSTKRQKCKLCSKAFKTVIALRRHVFLKHTNPADDSEDDS